jgi:hypothetical protein
LRLATHRMRPGGASIYSRGPKYLVRAFCIAAPRHWKDELALAST